MPGWAAPRPLAPSSNPETTTLVSTRAGADVVGRVIAMEAPYQEPADFDGYRLATRVLWILLLLPVVLVAGCMVMLLRLFSLGNLLSLAFLQTLINPFNGRQPEQVPVRYLRVRDEQESEWMVRVKGRFTSGNVGTDDLISLWGKWRGGTLAMRRGYNHRTNSRIELARSWSWLGFAVTVGIILVLMALCYSCSQNVGQHLNHVGGGI